MTVNLGVKALLCWANSLRLSDRELCVDDFQDGTILLKVVYMLKKDPTSCFCNSIEDRFRVIADFVERDCRFNASKGTSLSWDNIRDGINLRVEIAKVLLLLVYHDIMNDRCTLNMLDCDVEREIANLTGSFVMESEGCVHLGNGLDGYLTRKHLPVNCDIFEQSEITSTSSSNASTISSFSDEESPVFPRKQKITFVDMQTVASSSVSKSPLRDIMNTPKFQMRKMQRQMIKERDYRDGLERELANNLAVIAQKETHINQLQYRLEKQREEQSDQERVIREQIAELENKNNMLKIRLNEILKENKDFKSTSSLMERKVDELTEQNGLLSSQMRAARSHLAIFEAEVGRLTENQEFAQMQWREKSSCLESELSQATAQKEFLNEQIQILQGKISCLEDELSRASKEEVGENMGPIIEREMFETEIRSLKDELERAFCSLKKAEIDIQGKTQQLAECQEELIQQKGLLKQQMFKTEEMIQAKDEILDKMQNEITEQRAALQQEIQDLQLQLEHAEQQKCEQMIRLQQHIATCEQEVEKLKEIKKEKEDHLRLAEENMKDLETKLSALSSVLADKDEQINSLKEEIDMLEEETKRNKNEIEAKEEKLANLLLEKSNEQKAFENKIQVVTAQIDSLTSSLKQAEQEVTLKQELLAKTQEENIQQRELLQQQIVISEEEVQKLNKEIQLQNEQLVVLKNDSTRHAESLEQEIQALKGQLEKMNSSLRKAEEQVQAQEDMLIKHEKESVHRIHLLQEQLSASEETVKALKEDIHTKDDQMTMLKNQCSQQSEIFNNEVQDLKKQTECLRSLLRNAEANLQHKEKLFAEQCLQASQDMDALQKQMVASQDEVKRLNAEIHDKEEQLSSLKAETLTNSELLQQEIESLNKRIETMSKTLDFTKDQFQAKEDLMAKQEQEGVHQRELLQQQLAASEEEVKRLKEEIQHKEEQMILLKTESSLQSDLLCEEIKDLKKQVECLTSSLKNAEDSLQSQEKLLSARCQQSSRDMEALQMQMITSQDEAKRLKCEIEAKEQQLTLLENETAARSELLQQEVESLNTQLKSTSNCLEIARDQVRSNEDMMAKQEQERTVLIEDFRRRNSVLEEDITRLREEIQSKESEVDMLKVEKCKESQVLQNEVKALQEQVKSLNESLKTAIEQVQDKEALLTQKEMEISQEKNLMTLSEVEIRELREQIQVKEEQLVTLKKESSMHSDMLQQDVACLQDQLAHMSVSLTKAEEKVQTQLVLLAKQEEDSTHQKEDLHQQLSAAEEQVKRLKEEIQAKEGQMIQLKTDSSEQSELLHQEIQSLKTKVETLGSSLRDAQGVLKSKEDLLLQQQEENTQQRELVQRLGEKVKQADIVQVQSDSLQEEIQKLKNTVIDKDCLYLQTEEKLQILKNEQSALNILIEDKDQTVNNLRQEVAVQANFLLKAKEEGLASEKMLTCLKEENSKQTQILQHKVQDLNGEVEIISQKLLAKEKELLQTQQESAQQMALLQQQFASVDAERQAAEELHRVTHMDKEALIHEKEVLLARILQGEKDQKALEKQLEDLAFEKDRLAQAKQVIEKESAASHKLESVLQQQLDLLKMENKKLLKERENAEEIKILTEDLQNQLSVKSEAVEHYKAQMEKAANHYNSKKQLLQESQEEVAELKQSLEVKERELKAITTENKMLQLDLDKVQTNEKKLTNMVASLEAQLAFVDHKLREQNKIHGSERGASECYLDDPHANNGLHTMAHEKKTVSPDSLDQSSLEDSLNNARKLSAPDESSTPLVRSSERLAAKRRGLHAESLETLYFTPINSRNSKENKKEFDSCRKNPTSSVKRRRTTQVINITMTKKTPSTGENDETFYSLASARSHPNLSSAHSVRPVSMELFDTPARKTITTTDQLIGLPGYRRSAVHSQSTSTFCVGAENEPDGAPEDWMRIAELQARNKACLPHLKSSYPVEFDTGCGNTLVFTDEELRTGDPSETIRRASTMPGQLQDSVTSHRLALMMGNSGTAAGTHSHRQSLIPGQLPTKTVSSSHPRSPKGTKRSASTWSVSQMSPEKKVKASCFPRPLTPKNKNMLSAPSTSQLHPSLSPAERRQSMMFTIDNTPKNSSYLKKGLNKLRGSTRKSPGKSLKKSPAPTSARKGQENMLSRKTHTAVGRAGRTGSSKSPLVATKGQMNSPRAPKGSRSAKSPGLTASARKMMSRMKV